MNYLFVFAMCMALVSCSLALPGFGKYNGQPGCQTEEEIATGVYRHFQAKTKYWVCHTLGVPASIAYCPKATGFLDVAKACVPFSQWYWTPTELPPSQAWI